MMAGWGASRSLCIVVSKPSETSLKASSLSLFRTPLILLSRFVDDTEAVSSSSSLVRAVRSTRSPSMTPSKWSLLGWNAGDLEAGLVGQGVVAAGLV